MPRFYTEKEAIKHIQKYLREIAKEDKDMVLCPLDGVYSEDTRSAVKQFQYKSGLPVTGIVDKPTHDSIFERYKETECQKCEPFPFYIFPVEENNYEAKKGDKSFFVSCVQYILNELSYLYDGYENVGISGIFDETTENYISDFQVKNNLPKSGKLDRKTWNLLALQFYNLNYLNRR